MKAKAGFFLSLVPVCLCLLPAAAVAQGSVGPLRQFQTGHGVTSWATAGSLVYFTTIAPTGAYPPQFISGFGRSDGTWEGTFSIDPRGPVTSQGLAPLRFADSLGPLFLFTCAKNSALEDRGLWRSDGTVAGTFAITQELSFGLDSVSAEAPAARSIPERGLMFFAAGPRSGSPDFELWATDGTPEGTRLVKDVNPEGASNPRRMTALAGRLFFLADTPQGRELWRSDGTPEETERILDLHEPGTTISLDQAGGALFVFVDSESGLEVWRSDGTAAGTAPVLDLPLRFRDSRAAGRHLFLVAQDAGNHEMWAIDGGTGEAVRVLQITTSEWIQLFAVGDHVTFSLEDDHGREPWWSDGTPEGTRRVADICPGPCSSSPYLAGTYRGLAVLVATDGVSGHEPWLTDGTAAGTFRLGDFCPGECVSSIQSALEINGWLVLQEVEGRVWMSDGTRDGAWTVGRLSDDSSASVVFPDRILFMHSGITIPLPLGFFFGTLPVTAPAPPPGAWLASPRVPGFRFKVQIGQIAGRQEPACVLRTLCVSGAVPGHSEVFLRVSDPKPDGRRWPSLIKLTTSPVDVWVLQNATGFLRHYRLNGSGQSGSTLPGLLDREGFLAAPATLEPAIEEAAAGKDPKPPGSWIESRMAPGFRVQARLTLDGTRRILRKEPCNIAETFCLSGATPGVTDLLIRVTGPKPNKYFWPMLARFTPASLEVWVQQKKTGKVRYYQLTAPPADSPQLDGYFDRLGFKR